MGKSKKKKNAGSAIQDVLKDIFQRMGGALTQLKSNHADLAIMQSLGYTSQTIAQAQSDAEKLQQTIAQKQNYLVEMLYKIQGRDLTQPLLHKNGFYEHKLDMALDTLADCVVEYQQNNRGGFVALTETRSFAAQDCLLRLYQTHDRKPPAFLTDLRR